MIVPNQRGLWIVKFIFFLFSVANLSISLTPVVIFTKATALLCKFHHNREMSKFLLCLTLILSLPLAANLEEQIEVDSELVGNEAQELAALEGSDSALLRYQSENALSEREVEDLAALEGNGHDTTLHPQRREEISDKDAQELAAIIAEDDAVQPPNSGIDEGAQMLTPKSNRREVYPFPGNEGARQELRPIDLKNGQRTQIQTDGNQEDRKQNIAGSAPIYQLNW